MTALDSSPGGFLRVKSWLARPARIATFGLWFWFCANATARAADLAEAQTLFRTGRYDECAALAGREIRAGGGEEWSLIKIEAELERGKVSAANDTLNEALGRFSRSVRLRLTARRVHLASGRDGDAAADLATIEELIVRAGGRYSAPEDRLALGRYFLMRGADARTVLERFYDPVVKDHPDLIEGYYATAELALGKDDFALAAATLRKAPKAAALDPRSHALLAQALENDDSAGSAREIAEALKINPRHVESLLLEAERRTDAERYSEAAEVLKRALEVNSRDPRALARQAVLAFLNGDSAGAAALRERALEGRPSNPEVDYLMGRALSAKYRFLEGSGHQRKALELDPEFAPARLQLAQDLLRLGEESEGWELASQVLSKDGYNVVAFNLVALKDHLAGFRTLEADGLIVRMDPREADLYGARVVDLLRRARKTLCARYDVELKAPILVEIFPDHKDFAVRTFGLPGADGLLGVCFGRVVTANSPKSQGETPANLEAVLWHEFCHVVTLSKTRNRMPRWLSEGISVHEEARADRSWATALNPKYREMILGADLTPLSKLSSAFLAVKSPLHLQFAYFESAMAVEFLESTQGLAVLKEVLSDLGAGTALNEALPRRTKMTLDQLDRAFGDFARAKARATAPNATWEEPELPAAADSAAVSAWLRDHPNSFWGRRRLAARLIAEKKWGEAKTVLESLKALYPEYTSADNAYTMLAEVYRNQSDARSETRELEDLAARKGDAGPAYIRLMELDRAAGDWTGVARNARRMLAVNPLVPAPHRMLALAAEREGNLTEAVAAARAVVALDQIEPAESHFQLARLLERAGDRAGARSETVRALEEAPRFLEAYRLLLDLERARTSALAKPEGPKP